MLALTFPSAQPPARIQNVYKHRTQCNQRCSKYTPGTQWRQKCQLHAQLRMTGLCWGLLIKQKQLKKPTEECFKEQFLLPFLPSGNNHCIKLYKMSIQVQEPFKLQSSARQCVCREPLESRHGWRRGAEAQSQTSGEELEFTSVGEFLGDISSSVAGSSPEDGSEVVP